MEEKKVPALRFRGFDNAWEQKELGELFSYLQNNTLSRAELNDNYGVAQSIHYGDVLIKYGECLDVSKERLAFIEKQSIADKFKTAYLQDGDIIVADTAEDGTVGKCTEIQDLTDKKIISGLHTIPLRPDQKFASGYLGFYMNSNSYHDQLKPLMQGIKVTSISKSAIQNTVVRYPFSLKEQGLVSRYLCLLNTLISLHQRKLEMLKKVKKSMLEKMFPKNDAKVPEVRFSDFTDAWEQRRLGEIGTLKNGMNFSKDAMGHGFPFVNLQDIFGKTIVDDKNLGKAEASTGQLRDYNLLSGDVLFVRSSVKLEGVGETALVLKDLNNTTYSGFIIRFRDESGIMNLFKRIIFTTGNVRRQIVSQATDSANKNISQVVLANLQINVPSSQEQKIVGSFFHYLDHLISLHQRKLEKLKNIKKSMLEKMFII